MFESLARSNNIDIPGASGLYLSAPGGVLHLNWGSLVLTWLQQSIRLRETRKASFAQVVDHVNSHVVGARAGKNTVDCSLVSSGFWQVLVEELRALSLSKASSSHDSIVVSADWLDFSSGFTNLEVETIADGWDSNCVLVCAESKTFSLDDKVLVACARSKVLESKVGMLKNSHVLWSVYWISVSSMGLNVHVIEHVCVVDVWQHFSI